MNTEDVERTIARMPKRRPRSPMAQKIKDDLAERRMRLADYFYSVSELINPENINPI